MKMRYPFLATLTLLAIGQFGCDHLPEAFSGKHSSDTKAIHAVGPNQNDSQAMASVTPGLPENIRISELDPNLKEIDSAKRSSQSGSVPTRLVNSETDVSQEAVPASPATSAPPIYVPSASPSPGQVEHRADGVVVVQFATLKFVNDVEIAAPADGIITRLDVQEGDFVEKDIVLVELDKRLVEAELEVAKNELKVALEKSKDDSEIKYSKSAEEVARQDFENSNNLLKLKVESNGDNRKKWLEHRRSVLAIDVAELKHSQDIVAVDVSRAKEQKAYVQADLLTVKSPFASIVASKEKDVREWVRSGEVILRVVSLDRLRAVGTVSVDGLQAAPHLLVGAPVKVKIQLYPTKEMEVDGKVDFVSPVMDSSRGYKIWVEVPNQMESDQWLFREGMFATIEINTLGQRR